MPLQTRLLNYENAQILLIGEQVGEITKALEPTKKDEKEHKETPMEEMEKLEHEDELRVRHLKGNPLSPSIRCTRGLQRTRRQISLSILQVASPCF